MKNDLIIGALAGIAAGAMVFAAVQSGVLAFVLLFAAPLAIYIVTMGWGRNAGVASVVAGLAVTGYGGSPATAVVAGTLLFVPACWVAMMANLGQRGTNGAGAIVWFPLSIILFRLMLALLGGFLLFGAVSGYSNELVVPTFVQLMQEIAAANPQMPVASETEIVERATTYANLIPLIVPGLWLMLHVGVAFLAAKITRRSGLMAREEEEIAANVSLPPEAIILLVAGFIGILMLPGIYEMAAKVAFGIAVSGFGLIGLAQLHHNTKGMAGRTLILSAAYGAILLFTVPLVFFAASGTMRSLSSNQTGPKGPSNKT